MTNPTPGRDGGAFSALMRRPYLILILCNVFWGGNVVAGKLAVGNIDPYVLTILRWAGAAALLLPFAIPMLRRNWPIIRRHWMVYLFYGVVGFATFNMLTYLASHHTSGVNIALEQVAVNIFVMALNFAAYRIRVRALQLAGVAITIVGVAVVATHGDPSRILTLDINAGDAMVIAACFAYAVYSLSLRYRPATDWLSFLIPTFLGALAASFVYQLALGGGLAALPGLVAEITWQGWLITFYTVLFPSIVSQMFYVRGVELIGSNRASLFINLIPLFGTLGSVVLLGERLEGFHLAAAGLIAVGIVLAEWSARRERTGSVAQP